MNFVQRQKTEKIIKLLLTFSLLIFSIIAAIISNNEIISIAMLCSSIGDILIMASRGIFGTKKNKDQFIIGTLCFAIAHYGYLCALLQPQFFPLLIVEMCLVLGMITIACINKFKTNKIINILYALCILISAVNAFNFHLVAGIGYVLFIISDIILIIKEDKERYWQIPIWIFYVAAQMCILTSPLI